MDKATMINNPVNEIIAKGRPKTEEMPKSWLEYIEIKNVLKRPY